MQHKQVYCKLSGLITEANRHKWYYNDFVPFLDVMVEEVGLSAFFLFYYLFTLFTGYVCVKRRDDKKGEH